MKNIDKYGHLIFTLLLLASCSNSDRLVESQLTPSQPENLARTQEDIHNLIFELNRTSLAEDDNDSSHFFQLINQLKTDPDPLLQAFSLKDPEQLRFRIHVLRALTKLELFDEEIQNLSLSQFIFSSADKSAYDACQIDSETKAFIDASLNYWDKASTTQLENYLSDVIYKGVYIETNDNHWDPVSAEEFVLCGLLPSLKEKQSIISRALLKAIFQSTLSYFNNIETDSFTPDERRPALGLTYFSPIKSEQLKILSESFSALGNFPSEHAFLVSCLRPSSSNVCGLLTTSNGERHQVRGELVEGLAKGLQLWFTSNALESEAKKETIHALAQHYSTLDSASDFSELEVQIVKEAINHFVEDLDFPLLQRNQSADNSTREAWALWLASLSETRIVDELNDQMMVQLGESFLDPSRLPTYFDIYYFQHLMTISLEPEAIWQNFIVDDVELVANTREVAQLNAKQVFFLAGLHALGRRGTQQDLSSLEQLSDDQVNASDFLQKRVGTRYRNLNEGGFMPLALSPFIFSLQIQARNTIHARSQIAKLTEPDAFLPEFRHLVLPDFENDLRNARELQDQSTMIILREGSTRYELLHSLNVLRILPERSKRSDVFPLVQKLSTSEDEALARFAQRVIEEIQLYERG